MGKLFVVATPIGNLSDISARAAEILGGADLIACEDTRHTMKLLHRLGIRKPLASYHEFNEQQRAQELSQKLEAGLDIALVSDAGTPGISDPGYRLVRECRLRNIPVVAVPGPNAAITALSVSGLPAGEFMFIGFLPARKNARLEKLGLLRTVSCTLVFYEAPHRIAETLEDIEQILGNREACVLREITKIHEESTFGKIAKIRGTVKPIGEIVVVVEGAKKPTQEPVDLEGLSRQDALRLIARKLGVSRKELYNALSRKGD